MDAQQLVQCVLWLRGQFHLVGKKKEAAYNEAQKKVAGLMRTVPTKHLLQLQGVSSMQQAQGALPNIPTEFAGYFAAKAATVAPQAADTQPWRRIPSLAELLSIWLVGPSPEFNIVSAAVHHFAKCTVNERKTPERKGSTSSSKRAKVLGEGGTDALAELDDDSDFGSDCTSTSSLSSISISSGSSTVTSSSSDSVSDQKHVHEQIYQRAATVLLACAAVLSLFSSAHQHSTLNTQGGGGGWGGGLLWYTLSGTGSQDLPHVVLWAQRVLQGLSTKYRGLFLVKVGCVRATSDQPQLWHRHVPLRLHNAGVEHAFVCFMLVNLDCPMDGRENMFVYGCGYGVPYPWQEVSMSMVAGDLWIVISYVIHHGGVVPREAPAGSTCIIAFAAIAPCRVDCETTMPIILPH